MLHALHIAADSAHEFPADPSPVLRANGRHGYAQIVVLLGRPTPGSTVRVAIAFTTRRQECGGVTGSAQHGHHRQCAGTLAPLRRDLLDGCTRRTTMGWRAS